MYVHCLDGSHVTGVVIMCLRKLQCWSENVIHHEYRRFINDRSIGQSELKFLEKFNEQITIPVRTPRWLSPERLAQHPTMNLVRGDAGSDEQTPKASGVVAGSSHEIKRIWDHVKPKNRRTDVSYFDTLLYRDGRSGLHYSSVAHGMPDTSKQVQSPFLQALALEGVTMGVQR